MPFPLVTTCYSAVNNCKTHWPWPDCFEQTSDLRGKRRSSELFMVWLKHSTSWVFNSFLIVCKHLVLKFLSYQALLWSASAFAFQVVCTGVAMHLGTHGRCGECTLSYASGSFLGLSSLTAYTPAWLRGIGAAV